MAATNWELAWFRQADELRVWARNDRLTIVAGPSRVLVRQRPRLGTCAERSIETPSIAAVHVSVSPSWERHDVELVTKNGQHQLLAHKIDRTIWWDITYDGLNLLADTGWATDLAHALARTLAVPVTTHNL